VNSPNIAAVLRAIATDAALKKKSRRENEKW
jgi:hypothetical protein